MLSKLPGRRRFNPKNSRLAKRYRSHIREKAIARAKARIYANGKTPDELSEDALEAIVKDEEDKLYSDLKTKGIYALLATLGLSWWF